MAQTTTPLTQNDNNALFKILENKMSDKDINKVIEYANKKSFYYGLKDSPLNRPTLAKVVSLLVFIACIGLFAIHPLFFADKANVTNLANSIVDESLARGWVPPVTSFSFAAKITDMWSNNGETKQILEISDSNWKLLVKEDIINWYGKATFGKLWENLTLANEDKDAIMQMSRLALEENMKSSIKDFLDNSLEYDNLLPELDKFNYGVDTLINGNTN